MSHSISPTIELPSADCIAKFCKFPAKQAAPKKKYHHNYDQAYHELRKQRYYALGLNANGKVRKRKIKQP